MQSANAVNSVRRSSRVPVTLPVVVTSLEPDKPFSEICETLVVSAHGCVMYSPVKIEAGLPVQFKRREGRATMAHVVDCQPMGSGQQGWQMGARLDRPEIGYTCWRCTLPNSRGNRWPEAERKKRARRISLCPGSKSYPKKHQLP